MLQSETLTDEHRYSYPSTVGVSYADVVRELRELRESHDKILALLDSIAGDVKPTIEALKSSPILKMMGVK